MSDIKMIDVFILPLSVSPEQVTLTSDGSWGHGIYSPSNGYDVVDVYEGLNSDEAEAICLAVNNHDRLVEENAQLKADKTELVGLLNFLACTSAMSDSIFAEVNSLIQKHKSQ